MPAPLFDFSLISSSFTDDSIILSSNRRLANQISAAYDYQQEHTACKAWKSPAIYPLEEWTMRCWQQWVLAPNSTTLGRVYLQPAQELLLWEKIIRSDQESALLKAYATAKTAQSTYRILQLWDTSTELDNVSYINSEKAKAFYEQPDSARFLRWAKQFEKICFEQRYINNGAILKHLYQAFLLGALPKVDHLILVGFQHIPPLQARLTRLAANKVSGLENETNDQPGTVKVYLPEKTKVMAIPCSDSEAEILAAASWAKQKLTTNPKQRIGIIVPDLAQQRARVERIFTQTFEPDYLLPTTPQFQLPFNISAGTSFGDKPLIDTALTLLSFNQPENDVNDLFSLLNSPFLLSEPVYNEALNDLQLAVRKTGRPRLSLAQLRGLLGDLKWKRKNQRSGYIHQYDEVETAFERFTELGATLFGKTSSLVSWLSLFQSQLEAFGWPGKRRLNSIEYQQITRWQNALQSFSKLQPITGDTTFNTALSLFRRHIGNIDFQAESRQTPIQILGMLEGSGLVFDALWLVGLNDNRWPEPAKPNPFIPIRTQVENSMPHASAERELYFSGQLFNTYLSSAAEVVASYSLQDQDQPLRPSAFITNFPTNTIDETETGSQHPFYDLIHNNTKQETMVDNLGPNINLDLEPIVGGSQILKNQAACPFKAFATHRLGAKVLDESSHHLTPQHRGIALHRGLEYLWRELKDFNTLVNIEKHTLEELLQSSVEHAIEPLAKDRSDLFTPNFKVLESERLKHILQQWLQQERLRIPFNVQAIEAGMEVTLSGLTLQIRIDRIDRLDDGSLMIIDYKSANSSSNHWSGDRPDEPQLPLYAVTFSQQDSSTGDIKALAFAQINIDKQRFVGLSANQDVAPGVYPAERAKYWNGPVEWNEIISDWQLTLNNLATQFQQGFADVTPKDVTTCRYCHLKPVCRIYEQRQRERACV